MQRMADYQTAVPFWQRKPGRYFEQGVVLFFLSLPPIGFAIFLWLAWQNQPGLFLATAWPIGVICAAVGAHIKWVRPYLTKYPFVESYGQIAKRVAEIRARRPDRVKTGLIRKVYAGRIARSAYRLSFAVLVGAVCWRMWDLHHSQFLWQVVKYAAAGFGITFGYHRMAHRAFQAPKWVQYLAYSCGCLANQGIISEWYRKHTKHHAFAETSLDVHSPIVMEESRRGIWHAWVTTFLNSFVFWAVREPSLRRRSGMSVEAWQKELWDNRPREEDFLYREEDAERWGPTEIKAGDRTITVTTQEKLDKEWRRYLDKLKEIDADPVMTTMSNPFLYFFIIIVGGFVVPYYLGGVSAWASFASICLMSWATFAVNSVSHLWGERPFATDDNSYNNAVVEIIALGEGGHNTHHYRAAFAVHGAYGWMFDPTGYLVRLLEKLRILKNVNYATRQELLQQWRAWRGRLRTARA
jgi:stearoyl-CoA desaturase (delta-9 desaturase)